MQYELAEGRSDDDGPAASPMIKLAKMVKKKKRVRAVGIACLPLVRNLPNL